MVFLGWTQTGWALTGNEQLEKLLRRIEHLEKLEPRIKQLEKRLAQSEAENAQLRQAASHQNGHGPKPGNGNGELVTMTGGNPSLHDRDQKIKSPSEREPVVARKASDQPSFTLPERVELGSQGLKVVSSDENFIMYLRALIQADASIFFDNVGTEPPDTNGANIPDNVYMRRIRPIIEGTLWKYVDYRIMPDFAPGPSGTNAPRIFDAIIDLRYFREASLAAGIMKAPVSLERLASASHLSFVERAWPNQLAPNRQRGFLLHGEFDQPGHPSAFSATGRNMTVSGNFPMYMYPDFLTYQFGVFNGASNNGSLYSNSNDSIDFQGRLFVHPFLHTGLAPLEGLGIGLAGTYGSPNSVPLSSFQSPGLQTIFTYNPATQADGNAYRLYPQSYWIWGPFKLVGEYALANQDIANQVQKNGYTENQYSMDQNSNAWNITMDYVLTGEHNSFLNAGIRPRQNFNPFENGWGAWVVAARYSPIHFGSGVFRNFGTAADPFYPFADPRNSVESADTWALGANWWLNPNTKLMFDYSQTGFRGGATALNPDGNPTHTVIDRMTEKVFQTRMQVNF